MTEYRDPDKEVVGIIAGQITTLIDESIQKGEPMGNHALVYAVCHLYENKEFLLSEAGMEAPKAAKKDLDIKIICDKIDKIRGFAWNGDTDPQAGLNLAEAAAPFFREHGVKIKKLLNGEK